MYSVHDIIKQKIDTLAIPGKARGKIILKSTVSLEAPSIIAASSMSMGIVLKKAFSIQTAKGVEKVTLINIKAK
tara:strand:- start:57 stop:278 length:222 start_codon:yes stop_codon:yes gene_type:complete